MKITHQPQLAQRKGLKIRYMRTFIRLSRWMIAITGFDAAVSAGVHSGAWQKTTRLALSYVAGLFAVCLTLATNVLPFPFSSTQFNITLNVVVCVFIFIMAFTLTRFASRVLHLLDNT